MVKRKAVSRPKLHLCAAAWTLTGYPSPEKEWSVGTKVKRAAEAGFDAISGGPLEEWTVAAEKCGLGYVGGVDIGRETEAERKLKLFKKLGVYHINVQLCDHDTQTKDAVKVARKVMQAGVALGLKPAIEVHRDTCTETPEKAYALASEFEKRYKSKLNINFDHSHPAIIKQVRPPEFWKRLSGRLDLLRRGELIHLRPFTGSHCQTPITNGRGQLDGDFVTWRDNFCKPLLEAWLKGAGSGKELYAVVELGPKGAGYGMEIFPDFWKDAIIARAEIERIWRNLLRKWKR